MQRNGNLPCPKVKTESENVLPLVMVSTTYTPYFTAQSYELADRQCGTAPIRNLHFKMGNLLQVVL